MAIEHADFDGIERLALVTGGEIVSTFDNPELVKLGECDVIEQVMIGEDVLLKFSGVKLGEACTIVIRGATQQIIDEADRSLHDALCVLAATVKESRIVYGGGCTEALMAGAIFKKAVETPGKEAIAMEAFASESFPPSTIETNRKLNFFFLSQQELFSNYQQPLRITLVTIRHNWCPNSVLPMLKANSSPVWTWKTVKLET